MQANSDNSISSLTNSLSNNVSVYVVDIAVLSAELVLFFLALLILFVFLNLICQSMGLSHLGCLILLLLHLNMLHYVLLSFAQFFFVRWDLPTGLACLELAKVRLVVRSWGIHRIAHFLWLWIYSLALIFVSVLILVEISLTLCILHVLILGRRR